MDSDIRRQLDGYSLTTAEILYYMPDHPDLVQTFLWQHYDLAPRFPRLIRFLDYWTANIEATLAEVRVAHRRLIAPSQMRLVGREWHLH